MVDTYLVCPSQADLQAFCGFFSQVIGPASGRAAVAENDTTTPPTLAQPAAGDPTQWYACIRAPIAIEASGDINVCDAATGLAVVGAWA